MDFINNSNLALDAMAVAGVAAVLIVLAILTLRSVAMRDRAMMFRHSIQDDARRASYEQRWRTDVSHGAVTTSSRAERFGASGRISGATQSR